MTCILLLITLAEIMAPPDCDLPCYVKRRISLEWPCEKKNEMSVVDRESPRILQNFIGGEYVDSIQTPCKYIPVTTPHTGEVIAQCPVSTAEDVEKAVEAAKEAFKTWRYYI
jgi:hypothetical protein